MSAFLDSIQSLFASRKAQVAATGAITVFLSRLLPKWGFSPDDVNLIGKAVIGLFGALILGIAHEDAAAKSGPQTQNNIASEVTNTPTVASAATPAVPDKPPVVAPPPIDPALMIAISQQIRAEIGRLHTAKPPAPKPPAQIPVTGQT